jgi:hypothetical protein
MRAPRQWLLKMTLRVARSRTAHVFLSGPISNIRFKRPNHTARPTEGAMRTQCGENHVCKKRCQLVHPRRCRLDSSSVDGRGRPTDEGRSKCCYRRPQGEVLRGGTEGPERLCSRPGHHLSGHIDRRFPGQCLETRAGWHLRVHPAAERRSRFAETSLRRPHDEHNRWKAEKWYERYD